MIRLNIINEVNNRKFGPTFDTLIEADDYIAMQMNKSKCPWGELERWIRKDELPAELSTRVVEEKTITQTDDATGETISWVECRVKKDFIIEIYEESDYADKRKRAYPSQLEIIEALMEEKEGRLEKMQDIEARRAQVKLDYPKNTTVTLLETR